MDITLIEKKLETLGRIIKKEFPEFTNASFEVCNDGYLNVSVLQWDNDEEKKTEDRKRVELLDQHRISWSGKWVDQKDFMNKYYREQGTLLEVEG